MKPSYIHCQPWVSNLSNGPVNELSARVCGVEHAKVVILKVMGLVKVGGRIGPTSELSLVDSTPMSFCTFDPGVLIVLDHPSPSGDSHLIQPICICNQV
jgi:hypothetical protein